MPNLAPFYAAIISLTLLAFSPQLTADESITSPDGNIAFFISNNDKNWLIYSVTFRDEAVVSESRLGLRFRTQERLDSDLKFLGASRQSSDQIWEQPWGERRLVRDHYNELLVQLEGAGKQRLDLRIRVFDDGVGFRYEVPAQPGYEEIQIVDELTEFHLPDNSIAWWIPGRAYNRYEYLYRKTGLEAI